MTEPIPARVQRGALLLDERLPGWVDRIDLDRLELESTCGCILGQEFINHPGVDLDDDWAGSSPYDVGVRELFTEKWFAEPERAARLHGFNAINPSSVTEFDELTAEWRRLILARRAGAPS